jgi:hypothetical protein
MLGVDTDQVMLMHTFDNTERYALNALEEGANVDEVDWVTDHLLTVSVGIVAPDPEQMAISIKGVANDEWKRLYKAAGNLNFLEFSLTADIKRVSSSMLKPVAIQQAISMSSSANPESLDAIVHNNFKKIGDGASKAVIIAGSLAGVFAVGAAIMVASLIFARRGKSQNAAQMAYPPDGKSALVSDSEMNAEAAQGAKV